MLSPLHGQASSGLHRLQIPQTQPCTSLEEARDLLQKTTGTFWLLYHKWRLLLGNTEFQSL